MSRFADKVALITGASSGVGRAMALALAGEGATVWLVGRNAKALEEVATQARAGGSEAVVVQADLTVNQDVERLASRCLQEAKRLDLLVHSAGVIVLGGIDTTSVKDLDWQYRTNLRAPYLLTQALLPCLRQSQGQIVFMNSSAGLMGRAGLSQYAATKHGLKTMADSLREELNAEGIRVLSVFLGRTATPMQSAVHHQEGKPYYPERLLQPEDVSSIVLSALSLAKTAEVTDLTIRPMQKP